MRHLRISDLLEDLHEAISTLFKEDYRKEIEKIVVLKHHYKGNPWDKKLTPIQLHAQNQFIRAMSLDDKEELKIKTDSYLPAIIAEFGEVLDNV